MPCFECHRLRDEYEFRMHERAEFLDELFAAIAARESAKVDELTSALLDAESLHRGATEQLRAHEASHSLPNCA
jgi:hypothetical protein